MSAVRRNRCRKLLAMGRNEPLDNQIKMQMDEDDGCFKENISSNTINPDITDKLPVINCASGTIDKMQMDEDDGCIKENVSSNTINPDITDKLPVMNCASGTIDTMQMDEDDGGFKENVSSNTINPDITDKIDEGDKVEMKEVKDQCSDNNENCTENILVTLNSVICDDDKDRNIGVAKFELQNNSSEKTNSSSGSSSSGSSSSGSSSSESSSDSSSDESEDQNENKTHKCHTEKTQRQSLLDSSLLDDSHLELNNSRKGISIDTDSGDFIENTPPNANQTKHTKTDVSNSRDESACDIMDPVSPYTDESDVNMSRGDSPYKPAVNDFEKERQNYFIASPSSESDSLVETDQEVARRVNICPQYVISPLHSNESDIDLSDDDPTYKDNAVGDSNVNGSSSDSDISTQRQSRKRKKDIEQWKQNKVKRLRNKGEAYTSLSKTHKNIPARCLKPPCTKKCKLKCTEKINTNTRHDIFSQFWHLGNLYKQRSFIKSSMVDITPKYKYTNAENPRKPNKAYYFTVESKKIRVCKTFFKSTLDISDRMIFTIQNKTNNEDFLQDDLRGKHGNHKKTSQELIKDIKDHINSIPRVESHYLRASTTREYIDGGKTIKDLYNDFVEEQKEKNRETGKYMTYYKIFNNDFNLSFFQPKKDLCDLCVSYENSNNDQKKDLEEKYLRHLEEKSLCRDELKVDRKMVSDDKKVVVFDLEAVLQCPRGDTSAFYYKSKLNSYNLTLTELTKPDLKKKDCAYENVHCYFWSESDAKRGANEIGTCVWKYLENVCKDRENKMDIIFYSDNCCGQNKNKYIMTMYMYAVHVLEIQSITHKFMIVGHTHNEADSVHSLIEKEVKKNLKSGPIYTPDQYIALIKNAKKSKPPINVHELTFDHFVDLKKLQEEWGFNFVVDENGSKVNWNDIKILKVTKDDPFTFYYKTSYRQESFKAVNVRNKRRKMASANEIAMKQLYTERQEISANKKKDLKELISKKLIPSYYQNFYNTIL